MRRPRLTRDSEVNRVRNVLLRESFPRVQMFLLVSFTGISGFVASFIMLQLGLHGMALRYLLAMGVAYAAFLGLLWIWLRWRADDFLDPELADASVELGANALDHVDFSAGVRGGGGSFDGGGASANFDVGSDATGSVSEKLGVLAEAEEAAIPLAVIVLVCAIVLSSLFVIYSAPVLFAEIIVDGVLSAGLYRRLRGIEPNHWIHAALKRTIWPFVLTAVVVASCGYAMQRYAPGAHSLGEVLRYSAQP
ncbi:MAG: hypothetical protein V4723_11470 [Pseudomonadota bacterium]